MRSDSGHYRTHDYLMRITLLSVEQLCLYGPGKALPIALLCKEQSIHCILRDSGKPTVPSPPVPDIPSNIRVLTSKEKQSCKERCGEESLECSAAHFPALNDCNRLREDFACEAGCEAGTGLALPAYIVPKAAKSERPAMCLTWSSDLSKEAMTCDSADSNRQRACPCGLQ